VTNSQIPKDRTVDALGSVWSSLRELLGTLTDEQWAAPTSLPGWDVRAIVAHIIGTEEMLAGDPVPDADLDDADTAHVRNDIGAANERWVRSMASLSAAEMLERFDATTARRLASLREMTQGEWDAESFTPAGRDTFGRFMQIRVFDCWIHEQDIRDAVGRSGHAAGQAVVVTLDEIVTALGFVIGKRAGVPAGTSVTFELTGSSGRTIHVAVDGRAAVVPALDGPADVTLSLGVVTFTRLCAGRTTIDDVRDQVVVKGDPALADQILSNLAYTI